MAQKTDIEWTDATWNPVAGCIKVGPGGNASLILSSRGFKGA